MTGIICDFCGKEIGNLFGLYIETYERDYMICSTTCAIETLFKRIMKLEEELERVD